MIVASTSSSDMESVWKRSGNVVQPRSSAADRAHHLGTDSRGVLMRRFMQLLQLIHAPNIPVALTMH
jgi:hypothetical protein